MQFGDSDSDLSHELSTHSGNENKLDAAGSSQHALRANLRIYPRQEHSLSRDDIDPDALKIMYRLQKNGFKGYLVGGGVRDLLLGTKPKDFDIATNARPKQIRALFRNSRVIGRRFRLVHVFFRGNKIIEVATFRADGSQDNDPLKQNEDNVYGTDATDAIRRDLTINALFYDLSTLSIIDYVGGLEDLRKGVIRIIGNPDIRFAEDPVRLIRTVRHAARTGFDIEPLTTASLQNNRELIKESSAVRIYEELRKDLSSGASYKILKGLQDNSLLPYLLPELDEFGGQLLSPESSLGISLQRIDDLVKSGRPVSTTVVLGIIALFIGDPDKSLSNLATRFSSKAQLQQHLDSCFKSLAVPRKERERMTHLLFAWLELVTTPLDNIRASSHSSKPYLCDLVSLFEITCSVPDDEDILSILRRAEHQRSFQHGDQRENERGRRRRSRGTRRSKSSKRFF